MAPVYALLFCFTLVYTYPTQQDWETFKQEHGKIYASSTEEEYRRNIFNEVRKEIEEHQLAYENGEVSYKMKLNQFSDWTFDEFKEKMLGLGESGESRKMLETSRRQFLKIEDNLPETVDWREKGAVSPIKNQGACGSCYAFGAIAALESHTFLQSGKMHNLSEQNIVDCTLELGNQGCKEGYVEKAYEYISVHGIDSEAGYPYEGVVDKCRYNPGGVTADIKSYVVLPWGDEESLKQTVAKIGPVAAYMNAAHQSFRSYSGGIYEEPSCVTNRGDHVVLVIGYGTEEGKDYWLLKNSWGTNWGDKGFMKIRRNKQNHCGLANCPVYPIV